MMKSFFFKVSVVSYVFYTLISGKILKQFWHEKCLLIFNFFVNKFLELCDFLGFSLLLCEKPYVL